jgi:Flp pilus assembly protein TadB
VLLDSAVGRTCFVVGLLLEGLGVVWMRRIVRSQP